MEGLGLFYTFMDTVLKQEEDTTIPMNPTIHEWVEEMQDSMSTFLRNDISLLFHTMSVNNWVILYTIHKHKLQRTEEVIRHLEELDLEAFKDIYKKIVDMEDVPEEKITAKAIRKQIEQNFFNSARGQEKLIYQLLKNPAEWKQRIIRTYSDFYQQYMKPKEPAVSEVLEKRIPEVQQRFDADPESYLDTLSLGHYKTTLKDQGDVTLYCSYTFDRGLLISRSEPILWFGLQREQLFDNVDRKAKTDLLFKVLGDPKRVEILRLVGKRTWYSNELAKHFKLTSATMSYHLNKLLSAGLLTFEVGEQNKIYYEVNRNILKDLFDSARTDLLGE